MVNERMIVRVAVPWLFVLVACSDTATRRPATLSSPSVDESTTNEVATGRAPPSGSLGPSTVDGGSNGTRDGGSGSLPDGSSNPSVPLGNSGDSGDIPSPLDPSTVDATPPFDPDKGPPAICPPQLQWATGTKLALSTDDDEKGLRVTSDELTVAWFTVGTDGAVSFHIADRNSKTDPFGSPQILQGAFAPARVALTRDGLGLAAVNADGLGFTYATRDKRGEAFKVAESGPFALLNAEAGELATAGERFDDPLVAGTMGGFFVYSRHGASSTETVFLGSRIFPSDPYAPGTPFGGDTLAPQGTARRSVTGASDDFRTLFVFNHGTQRTSVATLDARGAITQTQELGELRDLQASADCHTFYYTQGSPGDLYVVTIP